MPRLSRAGRACHGLVTLSVDGVAVITEPPLRSTRPVWLTDLPGKPLEACYQVEHDGTWSHEACDVDTKQTRTLDTMPGALIEAGGDGTYAWQDSHRVYVSTGLTLPGAGLLGVGYDGCIAYSKSYQAGTGIVFRSKDGVTTQEFAAGQGIAAPHTHIVACGVAAYVSGGRLHTVGTPAPVTVPEEIFEPRLLKLSTGVWAVLYHTQTRLLLQPNLEIPQGYVIASNTDTFAPDLYEPTPGVIGIGYCTTPGEGPGRYVRVPDLDLKTPTQPLTAVAVAPFKYPMWVSPFDAISKRDGTDLMAPCNCAVITEAGLDTNLPVMLADTDANGVDLLSEWAKRWERQAVAVIVARELQPASLVTAVADVRRRMAALGLSSRPILAYAADTPPVSVGADWVAVQLYPNPGESAPDAEHRWRNTMQRVANKPAVLICGAFDRRTGSGQPQITPGVMEACMPIYAEIARSLGANCKGLLWFAMNRPGGVKDYPQLRPWLTATVAAAKVPPMENTTLKTPVITEIRFDGLFKDGWHWTRRDDAHPDLGLVIDTWIEGTSLYESITMNGLTGRTQKVRKVL